MEKPDQSVSAEDLPSKCQSLRLRSIRKRIETEQNKLKPKSRRPRERPAPLSKYRRKTANARERERMQEVNVAFEKLKSTIPHHKLKQIDEKKDTKITTLRCAITYINSLSELLVDIEKGRSVSPEYYFTDAQLGLEPEGKKKKRNQRGNGNVQLRSKREQNNKRRKKVRTENIDITKQLEHINIPHEIKLMIANGINKSKKFNNSSPYFIDNRPKLFKRRKKDFSPPVLSQKQILLVTNPPNFSVQNAFDNSVLQTVISNNQQNVINLNGTNYTQFPPNYTNMLKPVVISRRHCAFKADQEGSNFPTVPSFDNGVPVMINNVNRKSIPGKCEVIRFNDLTPILPRSFNSQQRNSSVVQKIGQIKSSPPAAVLALVRDTSVDKSIPYENELGELLTINDRVVSSTCLPFSSKGLQPISSQMIQQFMSESNLSRSLCMTSPSTAPVLPALQVPSNYPTSPSSSSTPSSSPSLFGVNYQNDDKTGNTCQDSYSVSDDISELTPSLTTTDLEHQLINGIDYSNVGSIQEFLVEFENSSEQTFEQPDTIVESNQMCVSEIIG